MSFLQEHDLLAYPDLESVCDAAVQKYNSLSDQTKANSAKMKDIAEQQRYIGTYAKTREVYMQYHRLPPRKQSQFYAEHTSEIISCEAAKRYFNSLGLKKLPTIQSLRQEYAVLMAENKKLYPDQKKARTEIIELLTVTPNTMRILGLTEDDKQREQRQKER